MPTGVVPGFRCYLRFCESSISASLEVWRKYLYAICLAVGCQTNARIAKSGSYEAFPMLL
jgi:hypothetical protein